MMHEVREGAIGTPPSAARPDWTRPRLPYGISRPSIGIPREDRDARRTAESSDLPVEPRGLADWLNWSPIGWCDLVLACSWLIIGLVAAYDTYLSVKFQETLPFLEVNPLCRMLIAADEGSVAMLLGFKFAGTVLTLGTILLVYQYRKRVGVAVASVVAGLQGTLFLYLSLG
jgi:hypothetical protein